MNTVDRSAEQALYSSAVLSTFQSSWRVFGGHGRWPPGHVKRVGAATSADQGALLPAWRREFARRRAEKGITSGDGLLVLLRRCVRSARPLAAEGIGACSVLSLGRAVS
jgi:hypothetical protein